MAKSKEIQRSWQRDLLRNKLILQPADQRQINLRPKLK